MNSQLSSQIVEILSDGQFHSGAIIGEQLGVSRAAVSQHIKKLQELGLDVYRLTGKGYKLANPLSLIKHASLFDTRLPKQQQTVLFSVDSTNDYLISKIRNHLAEEGEYVVAETQTAGKGRRGRNWHSPIGSHIYFSKYVSLNDGLSAAAALSLAIGIAVARTCQEYSEQRIELKWPNDVLVNNRKLAGVLVEAEGQSDGKCHLVVGIGININMPDLGAESITQPWVDLKSLSSKTAERNEIIKQLNYQVELVVKEYQQARLTNLYQTWNQLNAHKEQIVELATSNSKTLGVCKGIDDSGALLIAEPGSHKISKVFGGEISLRATS